MKMRRARRRGSRRRKMGDMNGIWEGEEGLNYLGDGEREW